MNHLLNCLAERWQTASPKLADRKQGIKMKTTIMLIALVAPWARSLAVRQLSTAVKRRRSSLLLGMMQAPQWLPTEAYDAN